MKSIRLTRGRDIVDMRGYPGFPSAKEDPEGKYVFHALESRSPRTTAETRGRVMQVTNEQAEELLTHPTAVFEEVTPEAAEVDLYRRTLTPDMFGVFRDPRTGAAVDRYDPNLTVPKKLNLEGVPTPADEVRASVAATMAAEKTAAEQEEATKAAVAKESKAK